MPSLLTCPSCSRKLRVPPDLVGRRVKCPSCGNLFEGPSAAPESPADDEQPEAPRESSAAVRARPAPAHAGGDRERDREPAEDEDDEEERPWERRRRRVRRDAEPHRGGLILVLGIVSVSFSPMTICCGFFGIILSVVSLGLGIPAWVMGRGDLRKMDQGVMDPDGRGQTQGGMVCGIIGTVLGGLGLLLYGVLIALYVIMEAGSLKSVPPPPPVPPPSVRPVPPPPVPRKLRAGAAPLRLLDYLPAAVREGASAHGDPG